MKKLLLLLLIIVSSCSFSENDKKFNDLGQELIERGMILSNMLEDIESLDDSELAYNLLVVIKDSIPTDREIDYTFQDILKNREKKDIINLFKEAFQILHDWHTILIEKHSSGLQEVYNHAGNLLDLIE